MEWLKNDETLRLDNPRKYQMVGNGTALKIRNIAFADTGAYMCQATNIGETSKLNLFGFWLICVISGGLTRDISSLVVQEQPTPSK